jgi:hypothetical protein
MERLTEEKRGAGRFVLSLSIALLIVAGLLYALELAWQAQRVSPASGKRPVPVATTVDEPAVPRPAEGESARRGSAAASESEGPTGGMVKCHMADGSLVFTDSPRRAGCVGKVRPVATKNRISIVAQQQVAQLETTAAAQPEVDVGPAPRRMVAENTGQQEAWRCRRYEEKLQQVRSEMRAGYRASEYNRLMAREREAKEGIEEYCD